MIEALILAAAIGQARPLAADPRQLREVRAQQRAEVRRLRAQQRRQRAVFMTPQHAMLHAYGHRLQAPYAAYTQGLQAPYAARRERLRKLAIRLEIARRRPELLRDPLGVALAVEEALIEWELAATRSLHP